MLPETPLIQETVWSAVFPTKKVLVTVFTAMGPGLFPTVRLVVVLLAPSMMVTVLRKRLMNHPCN